MPEYTGQLAEVKKKNKKIFCLIFGFLGVYLGGRLAEKNFPTL
jgi:hypothetical protein